MEADENSKLINEILDRGVEKIFPSRDYLESLLKSDKQLTIYLGVDPTAPALHLGHAVQLKKLAQFQKLGHKIILLLGDFTAMIGDPTDKLSARVRLSKEEVEENLKNYKEQTSSIIDFEGDNRAQLKRNSEWLGNLKMEQIVDMFSKMTVEQMIKRDMFQERIKSEKPIYIHEFLYPLMQGFDSVVMEVDGEIGATDQTFNMLVGRDLLKGYKNKEKFVLTNQMLADSSGKKMSKSEGNAVWLNDSPKEMYGKIMSWPDGMIVPAMISLTDADMNEINKIQSDMEAGGLNPRDAKMRLAENVVSIFHGEQASKEASVAFVSTFSKKETPEDIEEIEVEEGSPLVDTLVSNGVVQSKAEYRRLVESGAIKEMGSGIAVDAEYKINKTAVFRVGKKRFVKFFIG